MIRWLTELRIYLKFYLYANETWNGADQKHKTQNTQKITGLYFKTVLKQFVTTSICL